MPDFQFNDLGGDDATILGDVQGNVLRGYGKLRKVACFIRFSDQGVPSSEDVARGRSWLQTHVLDEKSPLRVTTEQGKAGRWLTNFLLTHDGLKHLGCPDTAIARSNGAFRRGSRSPVTLERLNDLPPDAWQPEFKKGWHALLLVAYQPSEEEAVNRALTTALEGLTKHIESCNALDQDGGPLQNPDGDHFEPFGYRDGLSHLHFLESQAEAAGLGDNPVWDPRRPWSVVLTPDPLRPSSFASYFVVRKLRQDVDSFNNRIRDLVSELLDETRVPNGYFLNELYGDAFTIFDRANPPSRKDVETFVRSRVMGREPGGRVPGQAAEDNNFDFANDQRGSKCPFSAHIRKMNRRGDSGDPASELRRVIARRSMPFGTPKGDDCGLLFMCAQSDIAHQFEYLQQTWANDDRRDLERVPSPGPDHLVAQPKPVRDELDYGPGNGRYERYAKTINVDFRAYQFVTLRGAEYLVAPSVSGLRDLAEGVVR